MTSTSNAKVLVVGAGAAGLEAARALGARGYDVMLAEASREIGGRVVREASLPGMSEYVRVKDYREQQLIEMPNVEIFRESRLTAVDIIAVEADHVAIATGANWRNEYYDGQRYCSVAEGEVLSRVFTPDDIMDGNLPDGPTVVFDGDGYYMGSIVAEKVRAQGHTVTYVTSSDSVADWAGKTSERARIRTRMHQLGIDILPSTSINWFKGDQAELDCVYSGRKTIIPTNNIVMVTARKPNDSLYRDVLERLGEKPWPFSITRIGDCDAPAIIAAAVYAGHRYAQELDCEVDVDQPLRHDRIDVGVDG